MNTLEETIRAQLVVYMNEQIESWLKKAVNDYFPGSDPKDVAHRFSRQIHPGHQELWLDGKLISVFKINLTGGLKHVNHS